MVMKEALKALKQTEKDALRDQSKLKRMLYKHGSRLRRTQWRQKNIKKDS
jgi:hypothetical protein